MPPTPTCTFTTNPTARAASRSFLQAGASLLQALSPTMVRSTVEGKAMRKYSTSSIYQALDRADRQRLCLTVTPRDKVQRQVYRLKDDGEVISPWRGMFVFPDLWERLSPDEQTRRIVRTLAKRYPHWTFCQLTAAVMHGLETSYADLHTLHVAVSDDCITRSTANIVRHPLGNVETTMADGVLVTSLERTALDCLVELDFKRGLAIADSVLRVGHMSQDDLVDYICSKSDVVGWDRALRVALQADARAANGGESVARATMIELGFMLPDLQVAVPNVIEGGAPYYADFMWELPDGTRVAGELDGLDKYVDPQMTGGKNVAQVMAEERRRESRLGAANVRVVRFSYDEVLDAGKLERLLTAYGVPRA